MEQFDVPVVLIIFKRCDTVLRIIDRLREVQPKKIYILGDQGRDEAEVAVVKFCRKEIEKAIDWPCEIVKSYATENRGVHANIGLGARWVFEREEIAIFLEDDNLPEVSFFPFCREMLYMYKDDLRVLWVCGTNYLPNYYPQNHASYMFTQHLLPCGWASWQTKFNRFYDQNLDLAYDKYVLDQIKYSYCDQKLYHQQIDSILREKRRRDNGERFRSWDYHMALSIRANSVLGISPCKNQIKNIGVDSTSIHGGSSMNNIMTRRFCGMGSETLDFPLKHPESVLVDAEYDKKISNIILYPLQYRIKGKIIKNIKHALNISEDESLSQSLKIMRSRT